MGTIVTKDTMMLADVPEHARPEMFLDDEHLAKMYEREFEALPADDPGKAEAELRWRRAAKAAAFTAEMQAEAEVERLHGGHRAARANQRRKKG